MSSLRFKLKSGLAGAGEALARNMAKTQPVKGLEAINDHLRTRAISGFCGNLNTVCSPHYNWGSHALHQSEAGLCMHLVHHKDAAEAKQDPGWNVRGHGSKV